MNKNLLSLSNIKAKEYFLKSEKYCNFDLPEYFKFEQLLKELDKTLINKKVKSIKDLIKDKELPGFYEKINYKLFNNKDGKYAWRKLQLIHPVLYVFFSK